MTIYLSGSFTVLHSGHYEMFKRVYELSERLSKYFPEHIRIGIMSDDYIKKKYPNFALPSYNERIKNIDEYFKKEYDASGIGKYRDFNCRLEYFTQDDPEYMPQMKYDDVLIVSKETLPHALKLLEGYVEWPMLSVVPMIVDENGEEYHSGRILEKKYGRV